jgi:hypothetical protein
VEEVAQSQQVEPRAKKVSKQDFEAALATKDLKLVVELLLKMALKNEQLLRDVAGTIWHTFLFPMDSGIVSAGRTAGSNYHEAVQENRALPQDEQKNLGSPHIHVWLAVVQFLVQLDLPSPLPMYLKTYYERYLVLATQEEVANTIRFIRLKPGFKDKSGGKQQLMKITWAVSHLDIDVGTLSDGSTPRVVSLENLMLEVFAKCKGIRKVGAAPKSEMERVAQKYLDVLTKAK